MLQGPPLARAGPVVLLRSPPWEGPSGQGAVQRRDARPPALLGAAARRVARLPARPAWATA
eukprot:6748373-Alexandrium_andersonii.AAC.1